MYFVKNVIRNILHVLGDMESDLSLPDSLLSVSDSLDETNCRKSTSKNESDLADNSKYS